MNAMKVMKATHARCAANAQSLQMYGDVDLEDLAARLWDCTSALGPQANVGMAVIDLISEAQEALDYDAITAQRKLNLAKFLITRCLCNSFAT